MKRCLQILLVVLVGLLGWWAWRYFVVSEETRVQRVIARMQTLVEQTQGLRLAAGLENCVAQDYSDKLGANKTSLVEAIVGYRKMFATVTISISNLKITVAPLPANAPAPTPRTAEAEFDARVSGVTAGGGTATPAREDYSDHFHAKFRKTEAGWQMLSAESAKPLPL